MEYRFQQKIRAEESNGMNWFHGQRGDRIILHNVKGIQDSSGARGEQNCVSLVEWEAPT